MDLRACLLALLVTVLCAVGWVPVERAWRVSGDRVVAPEGVGVLPGRRQSVAQLELDIPEDDPTDRVEDEAAHRIAVVSLLDQVPLRSAPWTSPSRAPARERGPPSIA